MHRPLAAALATLIAAAVMSAASTAPEARVKSCRSQLTVCLNDCKGHIRDDYRLFCTTRCNNAYKSCHHDEVYFSTFPTFSLVTVSFAGMAAFAVIDQAEVGKGITASGSRTYSVSPIARGGASKPPTTGTAKANPPGIVRQHGDEKVFAPPRRGYCRYPSRGCYNPSGAKVRDHRQHPASAHPPPRVVPKEDPPQKW